MNHIRKANRRVHSQMVQYAQYLVVAHKKRVLESEYCGKSIVNFSVAEGINYHWYKNSAPINANVIEVRHC